MTRISDTVPVIGGESGIFLNAVPLRASIDAVDRRTRAADRVVELYGTYGAVVYARCRRMLREAATAEDVTQETFLRVHRHLGAIPDDDAVLPWLYRIATNLCLNALRDGRARPVLFEQLPERAGDNPDDVFSNRDLVARLVVRVPPKVQTTAWFFYVDGMKQDEIAEVLGISRRAVAKRLAQFVRIARKYLRREGAAP